MDCADRNSIDRRDEYFLGAVDPPVHRANTGMDADYPNCLVASRIREVAAPGLLLLLYSWFIFWLLKNHHRKLSTRRAEETSTTVMYSTTSSRRSGVDRLPSTNNSVVSTSTKGVQGNESALSLLFYSEPWVTVTSGPKPHSINPGFFTGRVKPRGSGRVGSIKAR